MKVYLVIEHSGYDGDNYAGVAGVFSTKEKAKEKFVQKVKWAKSDIGEWVEDEDFDGPDEEYEDKFVVYENYEFEETETHNFLNIFVQTHFVFYDCEYNFLLSSVLDYGADRSQPHSLVARFVLHLVLSSQTHYEISQVLLLLPSYPPDGPY